MSRRWYQSYREVLRSSSYEDGSDGLDRMVAAGSKAECLLARSNLHMHGQLADQYSLVQQLH